MGTRSQRVLKAAVLLTIAVTAAACGAASGPGWTFAPAATPPALADAGGAIAAAPITAPGLATGADPSTMPGMSASGAAASAASAPVASPPAAATVEPDPNAPAYQLVDPI